MYPDHSRSFLSAKLLSVPWPRCSFHSFRCGYKSTSCPDQFATALKMVKAHEGQAQ
ncbi:MAG: TSCPD domain-containing protein [Mogibacterium sp.]|nr:TSCPD domain-containing protein [Mogibacterium sp.]